MLETRLLYTNQRRSMILPRPVTVDIVYTALEADVAILVD